MGKWKGRNTCKEGEIKLDDDAGSRFWKALNNQGKGLENRNH